MAVVRERVCLEEVGGGHGGEPVVSDCQRGASGLLLCVFEYVDKSGDTGIFCPPQMKGSEHGNNVGTLKPTTVRGKQVKEIPWVNAGVEGVRVSETPDPSVFDDLED